MTPVGGEPGEWGPLVRGGQRFGRLRRAAMSLGVLAVVGAMGLGGTGLALYRTADAGLTRIPVSALEGQERGQALNVLVVGSDSRDGLTRQEELELKLGTFEGQRSDTVILASVTPDHQGVSLVSFPRDLMVLDEVGDPHKLTETFSEGPDHVVDIVSHNFGIPVHHYAEVSILGFMGVVETLGSVEICLEEPLRDRKSGAAFEAGCHDMDPKEALSYVRSRRGARGDFERIERQQIFLKAMLKEMVSSRTLVDLPRLFAVVERVADNVTTDSGLGPTTMRSLAEELRGLATGGIPMVVVPGYTKTIGGKSYVVAYRPGAEALFAAVRDGRVLEPRGNREERADTRVALWTGGRVQGTEIVAATLNYTGFNAAAVGPGEVDAGITTRVYIVPGFEEEARWVGATLGAPVQSLPVGVDAPDEATVVVAVGEDATS
jgi:LCP family protein required for cell wall assembly